jgi:hypothetical protein
VDAVRDDLGVCFGSEAIAAALEIDAQLIVVLDDAVVHDGEPVARDMRVGVALARYPVRRPAGVGNADPAGRGCLRERLIEHVHFPDGAQARQVLRAVEDGQTRRIVAAVFQPPQALHQDGDHIALGDRSDDSAHGFLGLD